MIPSPRPGQVELAGLVEGPLPRAADAEERLRSWERETRAAGVPFDVAVEGTRFSVLPELEHLDPHDPVLWLQRLEESLGRLLALVPPDERLEIMSTLRSVEYREDFQVQALYVVTPQGIDVKRRELPWSAPEQEVSRRGLFIFGGAVLVLLVLTLPFIDYGALWDRVTIGPRILALEDVVIEGAAVAPYVVVEAQAIDRALGRLQLTLRRGERFPRDVAGYRDEEQRIEKSGDLTALVVLRSVVDRGTLRVEYLDGEDNVLGGRVVDVRGLLTEEQTIVEVPLSTVPGWVKLRFGG